MSFRKSLDAVGYFNKTSVKNMEKDLNYYVRRFAKLNVNKKNGISAPHKPILLLAVIELIEQKKIQNNQIYLSPELIATFLKYWSNLVTTNHQSNIALPFSNSHFGEKLFKSWKCRYCKDI